MSDKALQTTILVKPSFNETDPMGIVWHGNYLKFFERAREVLFHTLDYDYSAMQESGFSFPVVDVQIKYRHPWKLQQEALVSVRIEEYENRLVTAYEVKTEDGTILTTARIVQMAFDMKIGCALMMCPPILFRKLGKEYPS